MDTQSQTTISKPAQWAVVITSVVFSFMIGMYIYAINTKADREADLYSYSQVSQQLDSVLLLETEQGFIDMLERKGIRNISSFKGFQLKEMMQSVNTGVFVDEVVAVLDANTMTQADFDHIQSHYQALQDNINKKVVDWHRISIRNTLGKT